MIRFLSRSALGAALSAATVLTVLPIGASQQPANPPSADWRPVVPGVGIARLRLGMRAAEVHRLMGKPREIHRLAAGLLEERWYLGRPSREDQDLPYLGIWLKGGRVVQVETTSPDLRTPAGIGRGSTFRAIRSAFPRLTVTEYYVPDGEYRELYFDDVRQGICFTVGCQDSVTAADRPESILVHRAGQPVLVRPGGQRVRLESDATRT